MIETPGDIRDIIFKSDVVLFFHSKSVSGILTTFAMTQVVV